MSNTRILNLIRDCQKYDEVFFFCTSCGPAVEAAAAAEAGGKIIATTEPRHRCCICGQDTSRLEYRKA
jgi:hypothetical protein